MDMWHKALAFKDCLAVMVLCCSSVSKSVNERLKGCVSENLVVVLLNQNLHKN